VSGNTRNAVDIIDCKACDLETKHSPHSFARAMAVANIKNPERCLFLDDSLANLKAARRQQWRAVLVGRVGRDCGTRLQSEHAELELDSIHDLPRVMPELFVASPMG
jgi:FMN phosphatase YigB (HAD superfamily)